MTSKYIAEARKYLAVNPSEPTNATVKRVAALMQVAQETRDKSQRFAAWKKLQDFVRKT